MKVLYVTPNITRSASGGKYVASSNLNILNRVASRVTVVCVGEQASDASLEYKYFLGKTGGKLKTAFLNLFGYSGGFGPKDVREVCRIIEHERPQVVWFDSSRFGPLIKVLSKRNRGCSRYLIFHYSHNVELDFKRSMASVSGWYYWLSVFAEFFSERGSLLYSDYNFSISHVDATRLEELYGRKVDGVLRPVFKCKDIGPGKDRYLLFVGSYFYQNIQAALEIVKNIAPVVDCEIRIVGSGMDQLKKHCSIPSNVSVYGYVEDISVVYSNALAVVSPVLSGAGLKIKIGEALSYGVPVIGTGKSFAGYPEWGQVECFVAVENVDDIPKAVTEIGLQKEVMRKAAFSYTEKWFSEGVVRADLESILYGELR